MLTICHVLLVIHENHRPLKKAPNIFTAIGCGEVAPEAAEHGRVVQNPYLDGGLVAMNFIFPYIGNFITPIDFHIFQRGGPTTNQIWIPCTTGDIACLTNLQLYTSQNNPFSIPLLSLKKMFELTVAGISTMNHH